MLTTSSGIFTAVDVTDAVLVKNGWLSVSFIGIGNFIIVLYNDVKYITDDIKYIFQIKAEKLLDKHKTVVNVCSTEVEVIMDNTDLYQYSFDRIIRLIKASRDSLYASYDIYNKMIIPIFDLNDDNFMLYKAIKSSYKYIVLNAVKELLVKLFVQNIIPYMQERLFHFTMIKYGKKPDIILHMI